jgi:hypothetical protein
VRVSVALKVTIASWSSSVEMPSMSYFAPSTPSASTTAWCWSAKSSGGSSTSFAMASVSLSAQASR